MKFQHTFLLVCAAVFMVGCAQNDATLQPQTNTPYIPPKLTKPSQHPLLHYPQEVDFLAKSVESKSIAQQEFTYRYYSPWFRTHILSKKEDASWANRSYGIKKQYYGENLQLISDEEIDEIITSTNFDAFGTLNTHAIMTQNAQMRNLPTQKPFFKKTTLPGEGYPFDYLQTSRIHIDEPIIVSHYTKDGAWAFIESSFASGWIPSDSFVLVDAKEKTTIIQAQKVALTKDNLPLYDEQKHFVSYAKIGAILPIDKEDEQFYYSYVYTKNATFDAQKISILLPKSVAKSVPFEFNKENISLIGNELLGEKYGWGGYLANRDCSAMTRDFTAPFGVWLPRNSAAQKDYGTYIPLKNLTPQEKEQMILKHGIAFLSLIYLKGHIMLYAGEFEGKPLVMHNVWGVRTMENGVEGRNVIGQAIISDLALGESEPNVPKAGLLVNRVEGILVKPADGKTNNFILKYPSVKAIKDNTVVFADGSTLPYDDQKQKTFDEKLENADIEDQLSQVYPAFAPIKDPALNDDPGRFRNDAFFQKLYGATKQEIEKNLTTITWLPKHGGAKLQFNKNENAAAQLQKVSNELDKLPEEFMKYLKHVDGTYYYRKVAGTNRLSAHSYGVAIDLDTKYSRYWQWDKSHKFHNEFPKEIIDIFEKYGFVWGGRWYHYDTMHFEYRPELFESID